MATRYEQLQDLVPTGADEDGWALYKKGPVRTVKIGDDGTETIVSDDPDDDDG